MTSTEAEALVKANRGGSIEGTYGPSRCAGNEVWEVWTYQGNEYHVRFPTQSATGERLYFSDFDLLCAFLERQYQAFEQQTKEAEAQRQERAQAAAFKRRRSMFISSVCAVAFLAAVGFLMFLLYRPGKSPDAKMFSILAGLIASGCGLFFGSWRRA